jgi:hypothetical protein
MKKPIKDIKLTNALREAGRLFQTGRPVDLGLLRQVIEMHREQRPVLCAKILDLLQEAEAAKARGDQSVGLTYYRAAIEAAVEELGRW